MIQSGVDDIVIPRSFRSNVPSLVAATIPGGIAAVVAWLARSAGDTTLVVIAIAVAGFFVLPHVYDMLSEFVITEQALVVRFRFGPFVAKRQRVGWAWIVSSSVGRRMWLRGLKAEFVELRLANGRNVTVKASHHLTPGIQSHLRSNIDSRAKGS